MADEIDRERASDSQINTDDLDLGSIDDIELDLPDFMPFSLTVIDPDILDLRAKRVLAGKVSSSGGVLRRIHR